MEKRILQKDDLIGMPPNIVLYQGQEMYRAKLFNKWVLIIGFTESIPLGGKYQGCIPSYAVFL